LYREDVAFTKAEAVTRILAKLTEEDQKAIGYKAEDMFYYCRYNGKMCNITRSVVGRFLPYSVKITVFTQFLSYGRNILYIREKWQEGRK
jgi:hypothetical protein